LPSNILHYDETNIPFSNGILLLYIHDFFYDNERLDLISKLKSNIEATTLELLGEDDKNLYYDFKFSENKNRIVFNVYKKNISISKSNYSYQSTNNKINSNVGECNNSTRNESELNVNNNKIADITEIIIQKQENFVEKNKIIFDKCLNTNKKNELRKIEPTKECSVSLRCAEDVKNRFQSFDFCENEADNLEFCEFYPFLVTPSKYNLQFIENNNVFENIKENELLETEKIIYKKYALDKKYKQRLAVIENDKNTQIQKILEKYESEAKLLKDEFSLETLASSNEINKILTNVNIYKNDLKIINSEIKNWIEIYNSNLINIQNNRKNQDIYRFFVNSNAEINNHIKKLDLESNKIIKNLNELRMMRGFSMISDCSGIEVLIIENNNIIAQKKQSFN
jgi:hypothetical protein